MNLKGAVLPAIVDTTSGKVKGLLQFLNKLSSKQQLPKIILYSLNPRDNEVLKNRDFKSLENSVKETLAIIKQLKI